jgi:protein-disulfide isomerase
VEESKDPRPEESQGTPESSAEETTGAESEQEQPPTGELLSTGEPMTGEAAEPPAAAAEPSADVAPPPAEAPVRRRSRDLLLTSVAAAIVAFAAVGIFVLGMFTHAMVESDDGGGTAAQAAAANNGAAAAVAQPTVAPRPTVEATVDDDPAQGPQDAPVTMIEFSDFQCPYCARFQQDTLPQILSNYGDKIRFVYRDFPLTGLHANAQNAAEASECADDQGKYWEYHDILFQNQAALDVQSLEGYAASLGLDTAAFNDCLTSHKYEQEVNKDLQDGENAGVQGTPSFFINGTLITGAQPYAAFQAAIEAALQKAGG